MAVGGVYYDEDGESSSFQPPEVVVVACNGVGTPRLLLNSTRRVPGRAGQHSGLVGKNLMFHPYASIQGIFDEPLDGYRGPGLCIWSQEFYETDVERGFVRGYTYEINRGRGPVATAHDTGMFSGRIPWGEGHHDAYRQLFNRIAGMVGICEDLPEEHNTVTLDPDLTDAVTAFRRRRSTTRCRRTAAGCSTTPSLVQPRC